MAKIIAFDEEARRGLERGMNQLADAVRVTPCEPSKAVLAPLMPYWDVLWPEALPSKPCAAYLSLWQSTHSA